MFRKRRTVGSGVSKSNDGSGGSTKQRVVDCTKVLLDVAKESADWFPPLKAALGGVSALINHYEQFNDVKEKIGDLVPQLERFKQIITTATVDGDPEETGRRTVLTGTFKQIEESSQKLLAKKSFARFADKDKDSKLVVGLIERLREAMVCYQISQQQAIYDRIAHLTSSINMLLKLEEKPPLVRGKLESVMARLNRLKDVHRQEFPHERRAKLFDDLRLIGDKVQGFYERTVTEGYVEDGGDVAAVSGLAEDLRDVLHEHWMVQQQAVYDQNCRLIDAADLSVLNNCRRAKRAGYRHGNRRSCLKGTRSVVLNEIESWAKDFNRSPVYWLNGLAGTGKSTIAQTVAEQAFAEERLGASFFCSRDFEDRSDLHFIFPTLAFQLAHKYPDFRAHIISLLKSNPDVVDESLHSQMQRLIVEPLANTGVSTVVVVDALDECKDDESSSAFLSVLGRFVKQIPGVKFFITGRPEPRIKTGFRLPLLVELTDVFVLHDVPPSLVNDDFRLFLKHELSEVAEGWPSEEHTDLLCHRAAGLFVYAALTVRFLKDNLLIPKTQLDAILKLPESTAPEGKTSLDSLYTSILQAAFGKGNADIYSMVRTTIGAVVLVVNPLPPPAIAELVALDPEQVMWFLRLIQSLLILGEEPNQPVKTFHKSFPDFITDPSRCADPRFYISLGHLHSELATNCLRIMNGGLERDLLSLPEYALNSEVEDLNTKINDRVSIALQYACRSWHNHLIETRGDITHVIPYLRVFLEEKFLAWLEVISVLGAVSGAVVALENLMPWLQEVAKDDQLLGTSRDYFYFVTKFFEPISASATHIYHSALELCPASSVVRKLYYDRCDRITRLPRVVFGTLDSWDQTISTPNSSNHSHCTWSPCSRFIAAQTNKVVNIWNGLTFELLTTLRSTETATQLMGPLAYSPDGRRIACSSLTAITVWDIQTGGVAKEIEHTALSWGVSLVWSLDGRTIGIVRADAEVCTYEVATGTQLRLGQLHSGDEKHNFLLMWAHEKSFRAVTVVPHRHPIATTVDVFEVGCTLIQSRSYTIAGDFDPSDSRISFSPATFRVSISSGNVLRIFEEGGSDYLLKHTGCFYMHSFSSDGSLFAASDVVGGVLFWKCTSGRYILWRKLQDRSWAYTILRFSLSLSSILGNATRSLLACRLDDLPADPQTRCQQYAGVIRSGNRIATAYDSSSTVAILDIHSPAPCQFIDTGVGIRGLIIIGNVLVAVGSGKLVAWLLTEEGLVGGVSRNNMVDHGHSIWTVSWQYSPLRGSKTVGKVGGIPGTDGEAFLAFHTETGELLRHTPQSYLELVILNDELGGEHNLYPSNLSWRTPPRSCWKLQRESEEAWVEGPDGRCRMWMPAGWRDYWHQGYWDGNTAMMTINPDKPVIIKP